MNRIALTAAGLLGAIAVGYCAAPPSPEEGAASQTPPIISTEISGGDLEFFTGAARATAFIVRLADTAQKQAAALEIQKLAGGIAKVQSVLGTGLISLGQSKGVALPAEPDGQGRKELQAIAKLKGPKFDKSCLDALKQAQAELEASLKAGVTSQDKDIKGFALTAMRALKQEQEQIRRLGL